MVRKRSCFDVLVSIFLVLSAMVVIFPILILIYLSLCDGIGSYSDFLVWKSDLLYSLSNSIFIAFASSIGTVMMSLPGGFVLAKVSFPFRNLIFCVYVVMAIIPFQTIMLPQYTLIQDLQIYDTLIAVVLPRIFAPFGVFLLTQSIKQVNNEILEAARLETSSNIKIWIHVLIPIIRPALLCVWVICFCDSWNAVSEPLVFMETMTKMPMAVKLDSAYAQMEPALGSAAAVVFLLLPLLIYKAFDSDIQEGLVELKIK